MAKGIRIKSYLYKSMYKYQYFVFEVPLTPHSFIPEAILKAGNYYIYYYNLFSKSEKKKTTVVNFS